MDGISELVAQLASKNTVQGYSAMRALEKKSARASAVYAYFDEFCDLLQNENSYVRTRALTLIAANLRYDTARRFDGVLDEFLTHILDEKPITARQCIKLLPGVAKERPDLAPRIRDALTRANPACYPDSMSGLAEKDILAALKEIAPILEQK